MASRLVVTALEKRVVPTVFFEEDEDANWSVMDGKQRLASLISFYLGTANIGGLEWNQAPTALEITDDTSCDIRWHGRTYDSLPERRKRIYKDYSIMCVFVSSDTDRDVVFDVYQDINNGAIGHTMQQSRKAAFHGPYVELLDELATDKHFLCIQGREQPDSDKEYDRELALRFFAMWRSRREFKTPMFKFLNMEIKDHQKADQAELERLRDLFKTTIATVVQIWGKDACRDTAKGKDRLDPSLWDTVMVAVSEELQSSTRRRKELTDRAEAIRTAYQELLSNEAFRKTLPTTGRQNVTKRIDLMRRKLQQAAPESYDTVRGFSKSVKQQLWAAASADGTAVQCGLCQQVIHAVDLAEVDHIKPWSHGGKTHITNAQLVHRYCNRQKGNRVEQLFTSSDVPASGAAATTPAAVQSPLGVDAAAAAHGSSRQHAWQYMSVQYAAGDST